MNIKPMCGKYTLLPKGDCQHDIAALVEEICNSSFNVILIDCGENEYRSSHHMANSIKTVFTRLGIKCSTTTIKGNDRQILLFKI